MNKKVFVSMLTLCVVFLVGLYIAKIFFPQEFMMSIQNERIIKIGTYIDTHKWLYYIIAFIPPFAIYFLYCCAASKRLVLSWQELSLIFVVVLLTRIINFFDENLAQALSITAFIFLPALTKGDIKIAAIVYTIHGFAQVLSLSIRSLPMYLVSVNFVTTMLMVVEMYIWLVLCYIIFNYKEEKEM